MNILTNHYFHIIRIYYYYYYYYYYLQGFCSVMSGLNDLGLLNTETIPRLQPESAEITWVRDIIIDARSIAYDLLCMTLL